MSPSAIAASEEEPSGLPVPNSSFSFWHTEPNKFLIGHRTTPDLPAEADIVIVGSGITGTSAARFLSEDLRAKGKKIVLLEAREACWGATGRNGGHCQPLLFDRGPDVAAFELKNVATVRDYIKENDIPCEWRTVTGCRAFWDEKLLRIAEQQIEVLYKDHPETGKHIKVIRSPEDLKSNRLSADCIGATLTQGAGSLWPYKYVTFILEKLIKSSLLNLQTNTPVTKIEPAPSSSSSARQIIHTPRGTIAAHTVILATNGYTSALLPSWADLIVPNRGEMSALLPPKNSTLLPRSYGFLGANGQAAQHDDYLIQRPLSGVPNPTGHFMFGGGRGEASLPSIHQWDDSVVDKGSARYLRRALLKSLVLDGETEGVQELEATHEWTGIMGFSRDDHPWVGAVPGHEGVYLAGGYTGHGMPNGTLCGKAVVGIALAEEEGEGGGEAHARILVQAGELPEGYLITRVRIERARALPTVEAADRE